MCVHCELPTVNYKEGVPMKRKNLPGQLTLELDWGLIQWVDSTGESLEFYEKSAASLYRKHPNLLPPNPLLEEIVWPNSNNSV